MKELSGKISDRIRKGEIAVEPVGRSQESGKGIDWSKVRGKKVEGRKSK